MGREMQRHFGQESQVVLTMPILEGLDGVQKMSKSYGNAIGIQEPPLEMYGKVMSISDQMMWRFYELLTDLKVDEIEQMKREAHPMQAKKDLAQRIVKDFHSAEAGAKAAEDWAKQFQRNEVPEGVEEVQIRYEDVRWSTGEDLPLVGTSGKGYGIRVDRMLVLCKLADSTTDAARKLKNQEVRVNGTVAEAPRIIVDGLPWRPTLRVGRMIKIALIQE
jgi:tyrosyl-tRNA synthetase